MAKPTILQKLKNGLALCAKNFPGFTETWNYLVDTNVNLCGDADVNPNEGHIHLDRSNPSHPVIRLAKSSPSGGSSIKLNSSFAVITNIALVDGSVQVKTREFIADNGVLTSIGDESDWTEKIPTIPHSSVYGN